MHHVWLKIDVPCSTVLQAALQLGLLTVKCHFAVPLPPAARWPPSLRRQNRVGTELAAAVNNVSTLMHEMLHTSLRKQVVEIQIQAAASSLPALLHKALQLHKHAHYL